MIIHLKQNLNHTVRQRQREAIWRRNQAAEVDGVGEVNRQRRQKAGWSRQRGEVGIFNTF